tara:strand:+ start:1854 stop:2087 length:234 start_codon:yes stop_codon:yes gene_type:complete
MPTRFVEVPPGFGLPDLPDIRVFNLTFPSVNLTLRKPVAPEGLALYALVGSIVLFAVNQWLSRALARRALARFGKSE